MQHGIKQKRRLLTAFLLILFLPLLGNLLMQGDLSLGMDLFVQRILVEHPGFDLWVFLVLGGRIGISVWNFWILFSHLIGISPAIFSREEESYG